MLGCDPRKTRMSCCWINCTWELGVRLRVIEVRVHCDLGSQVHSKIKRRDIVEFWKGTPATGVGLAGAGVWIVDIRLVELVSINFLSLVISDLKFLRILMAERFEKEELDFLLMSWSRLSLDETVSCFHKLVRTRP